MVPMAESQIFRYESHGKRDPFVPLIGQDKAAAAGLIDVTSVEDIKIEGIAVRADGKRTAIINGELMKENDKVGEVEVVKIDPRSVTILISGKEFKVKLPEEGGSKSE
jgi:hypothetical protein